MQSNTHTPAQSFVRLGADDISGSWSKTVILQDIEYCDAVFRCVGIFLLLLKSIEGKCCEQWYRKVNSMFDETLPDLVSHISGRNVGFIVNASS